MQGVGLATGELFGGTGVIVDKIVFEIAIDNRYPRMLCIDHGHQQDIATVYLREAPRRRPHGTHGGRKDRWIAAIDTESGGTGCMHLQRCPCLCMKQRPHGDFRTEVRQRMEQLEGVDKRMHITRHECRVVRGHHVVCFGVLDGSVEQDSTRRYRDTAPRCQIEEHPFGTHTVFL